MRRFPWLLLFALILGAGLGLLYSWVIAPVRYTNTSPDSLRPDFKEELRASIAAAYAATGNLERARARLALLGDPDIVQALNAQAQRMVAAGDSAPSVQQVVELAGDLQREPSPTGTATLPAVSLPTEAPIEETSSPPPLDLTQTLIPQQTLPEPGSLASPTPRPTRTPTPAPGAPFELIAQDTSCDAALQPGLLQVTVTDARRRQVPGAEIIVTWDSGEERFFTGFKPELGDGYADFIMQPGMSYSVRVGEGGPPISGVMPPPCTGDGISSAGQIELTFQQRK
ncbi:MAG: hypothetical protein ACM3QS_00095 [Bacteroidota bacterium]